MSKTSQLSFSQSDTVKDEAENCRMCLEGSGEFISMDSVFECSSADLNYWEAFNFCTNLNAQPNDCLPNIICVECANNLRFVFEVLKKAVRTDQLLRQILGDQLVIEKLSKDYQGVNEEDEFKEVAEDSIEDTDDIEEFIYIENASEHQSDDEDVGEPPEFVCGVCNGIFVNEKDLNEHVAEHNEKVTTTLSEDESPAQVQAAETPPADDTPAEDALKTKAPNPQKKPPARNVICEVCGKCFSSNQKLKIHTLVHTKEKNFPCSLCPKRYSTVFRHREHMRTHANIRPHECDFCEQRFFAKHTLVCHLRRHTGERPYKCEICGKSFTQNSIMKTHAALHTGKTVECPHCFKKFSRPSHLILHQRSHTGERPYVCHLCSNSYKQKSHLDRHLDTHMGVKHTCEVCGKEYSKKSSLNTHMFVHAETKPYKCDVCAMGFATKDKYQRHLKNNHKATIKIEPANNSDGTIDLEETTADEPSQQMS